jgi:hypothetical protein
VATIKRSQRGKEGFYARKALLRSWKYYNRAMGDFTPGYSLDLGLAHTASAIETSTSRPAIVVF